MFSFAYPASFRPDEDGRPVVSFRDFPRAHTDGKDLREAMEEAIDCLGGVVARYMSQKIEIPVPSKPKRGDRLVPVPLWIAGKLALYVVMKERCMNNSQLARLLGVRETVIRRMLDPDHATKSEKIQTAVEALGKQFWVVVQDAAA
jgi:antitoxin HicB